MRLKEGRTHSFQPPSSVQSSLGSHVYNFTNGAVQPDSSSEDEFDVTELRARGGEQQRKNVSCEKVGDVIFLERTITENDNLNKLALQYGCKVADIKRINNLITDQDIYALKTIKIPVKVHGLLTENCNELRPLQQLPVKSTLRTEASEEASINSPKDFSVYFKEIDQNIEAAAQTRELQNEFIAQDLLSHPSAHFLGQGQPNSGADWGIRWRNAVVVMLLVGIVLPVFYIFYYKTQGDSETEFSFQNRTNISNTLTSYINAGQVLEHMTQKNSGHSPTGILQDVHKLLNTGG
ncbi:hypothetical protein GDO86_006458 [Hymenochirus boettgeri]|uniref:LysM and putative peptidoglycan-binding domain-containing protein 4 n=1 Tax=Hymenochirus boettgeri TaxID=247094 RepID=A0A8T2J683_9PIPI|nr:hypothetical protein GDO86_006458 [Hymenochirus boettgeri]